MSLARNIRFLRKKQGWGQDTLAERLGYKSYTTIQKWESGVSEPPLKVVHALSDIFGVDIDLLTNSDLEFSNSPAFAERDSRDDCYIDDSHEIICRGSKEMSPEQRKALADFIQKIIKDQ